jgi:hypothetical protein
VIWATESAVGRRGLAAFVTRHQAGLFFPLLTLLSIDLKISSIKALRAAPSNARHRHGRSGRRRQQTPHSRTPRRPRAHHLIIEGCEGRYDCRPDFLTAIPTGAAITFPAGRWRYWRDRPPADRPRRTGSPRSSPTLFELVHRGRAQCFVPRVVPPPSRIPNRKTRICMTPTYDRATLFVAPVSGQNAQRTDRARP